MYLGSLWVRAQKQEGEVIRAEGGQQQWSRALEEGLFTRQVVNVLQARLFMSTIASTCSRTPQIQQLPQQSHVAQQFYMLGSSVHTTWWYLVHTHRHGLDNMQSVDCISRHLGATQCSPC